MSIVGPRPEVPNYIYCCDELSISLYIRSRPGITDPSSLIFRNEDVILSRRSNSEAFYVSELLPLKIRVSSRYHDISSFFTDLVVVIDTFWSSFFFFDSESVSLKYISKFMVDSELSLLL